MNTVAIAKKNVSIEDIARVAGVGLGTVSRALNNQPWVSRHKRELVLRTAAQHGYQPHVLARALAAKQTRNIALVVNTSSPRISQDSIVLRLLDGMLPELAQRRYLLFFSALHCDFAKSDVAADVFGQRGHIDGLIVVTNRMRPGFLGALKRIVSVPLVLVDYDTRDRDVGCVTNDNFAGAYDMVKHLHGLGHRRIGFVADRGMLQPVRRRFAGYQAALADLSLPVRAAFISLAETMGPDRRSLETMLSAIPCPDALLAGTEDMIPEVLGLAASMGINVPGQINLAGLGHAAVTTLAGESLPTIVLPWETIGREAVRMITDVVEGRQRLKRMLVPPELAGGAPPVLRVAG